MTSIASHALQHEEEEENYRFQAAKDCVMRILVTACC